MPANLTPAYKSAEATYRDARDPHDKLVALRAMLRAIPKHKGTEHLQADIKARIKELTDDLAGPSKGGARTGPATVVKPEGPAQVALVGPPNSGKSSLHAASTGSHAEVGDYPFTTQFPMPGMMPVHDVALQLVDLPPVTPDHAVPWIANTLQPADGALLVVDLSSPGTVERVVDLIDALADRKVVLTGHWPMGVDDDLHDPDDPFTKVLPTVLVASKADLVTDCSDELAVLEELAGVDFPCLSVSVHDNVGIEELGVWLFDHLGVVRVYTKVPGKEPDMGRPYTVRHGATVGDVASLVHRDIAASLKFAKLWGTAEFAGQQVGKDHVVEDGDIVELHV